MLCCLIVRLIALLIFPHAHFPAYLSPRVFGGLGSDLLIFQLHFPAYSVSGILNFRPYLSPRFRYAHSRHAHLPAYSFPACSFSGILIFRQSLFGGLGPACSCSGSSSGVLICRLIFLLIFRHAHFPAYWSPRFQLMFLIIFRLNFPTCFFASFPGSVSGSFSGMLIFRHAHFPSYLSPKISKPN